MRSLIRGTSGFEKEAATQVPEQQPAQRHDPQLDRPADALVANVRPVSIAPSCARFSGTHAKLTAQFGDVDARGICIEIGCRYLNNNQLSGTIPSSIGQLGQLQTLCAPRLALFSAVRALHPSASSCQVVFRERGCNAGT